ncbi:MAG TPA: DUF6049 family protein [Acidimicrobiia bacterium]|nr:DUF6049 family protein [Acidimicrobiia bacterium]
MTTSSRARPRRWAAGAAALAVITATTLLGGAPSRALAAAPTSAPAPTTTPASNAPQLVVTSIPAWVAPGSSFAVHFRITGADVSSLLLRVSVHPAVTSRTAFSDTLDGKGDPSVVDDVSVAASYVPRAHNGDRVLPLGLQDPQLARDSSRLSVRHTGVYPLTLSLSPAGGDPIATASTWLVVAEQPLTERLAFAWVWQLQGPPLTTANRAAVQHMIGPDGRLGRAAQALAAARTVPLSLVLGPETLESWANLARHDKGASAGLTRVREAVADEDRRQVLATPYVPLNVPSLEAAGLDSSFVDDLRLGTDAVQSVVGVVPDPRTVLLDPVDAGALSIAHDQAFAQRFVVREPSVVPVPHVLTPARWFGIRSADHVYTATASSDFADGLLDGSGSAAERAQRFLAGMSLIALEAPSRARGIVLATPSDWSPNLGLVEQVLTGLRSNPFIRATTLDGYFSSVPEDTNDDDEPIVTSLVDTKPKPPTVTAGQLGAARRALASFKSLVGDDDPRVLAGAHAILIAPSSALDPAEAVDALDTIDRDAQAFLSSIKTTGHTITLTSRTARIPISFSNKTGQTVRVKLHLSSTKLTFPDGAEELLKLPPRNTTIRFPVTARTSGTFPMQVTLTTADDQFTISTTQVIVRSTVFSSIGVLLTVGALLFLAFWWGNHILRSRRAKRAAMVTGPATA